MSLPNVKKEGFLYHAYYCEENIWHVCQHEPFEHSYVIFIASTGASFPMMNQSVMTDPTVPILWDYHVVLLVHAEVNQILDFDTALPFCCDIDKYFSYSFLDNRLLDEHERPYFRVVPASEYITHFSSDRSHMKTNNGWLAPPPTWPTIGELPNNLSGYRDMKNKEIGDVLTFDEVLARFHEKDFYV